MKLSPQVAPQIENDESGQAVTEYVLLLFIVVTAYLSIVAFINSYGLAGKLTTPITQSFAHAYQYGRPDALGFDDPGGPKNHPRIPEDNAIRLFINPKSGS
jgi:hypothetical protein